MYWNRKHVLVCTASHCMQKGANNVAGRLRIELKRRGIDKDVLVNTCDSIDLCDIGPNIVVYPDNVIYSGVAKNDVKELVDSLAEGSTLDRLRLSPETPAEANRHDFYAAAVQPNPARPAADFVALEAEHGLDETWIAEQQRRGFIARKPASDEAPETITVTKKARARYGV